MPKTFFLLAALLGACLVAPSFTQESDNQPQTEQNNQQQQEQQQQQQEQEEQQQQEQNKAQDPQPKKQNQQLVDVSLDQGRTLAIPAGGELLELTVAVPKSVRSGQRYRYRARVSNVSDSATLANVRLVQIDGNRIDIEQAQLSNKKQAQSSQNAQQNKQQKKTQNAQQTKQQKKTQNAQQTKQQQNAQQNNQQQNAQQNNQQQNAQAAQQSTDGSNATWNLGQLKPGESQELAVTAIASDTGKLDHCFAVRYEEVLCAQVEVVKPTISITKAGPEQASVCELFEYRYELTNTGTGVAKDFVVRDELPEGLRTKSGKNAIAFRIPELKEGQTETIVAHVHSMKAGEYGSRAIVEQDSGETRQSREVTTRVIAPELDLQIEGPRAIKAGEGGNFDVTVTNTSDVTARNVVLTLNPDQNAEVTNAGNGDAREGGKSYFYDLGDLKPDESKRVSISLDSQEKGNVSLSATAKSLCARDQQAEQVVVAEADANIQARVMRVTGLLLSLVDTDDVIPRGETITYRLRVRNQGSFPDKNVKVNVELPAGLRFKEGDGPSKPNANGQRVSLGTVEKIEPGETLEWLITATAQSAGEKIVKGALDSEGLNNTVETQEVSTIYDASKQKASDDESEAATNQNESANQPDSSQTDRR